ncbi:MAG TPA: hypothetical protein VF546_05875 [Pyrinomonadaceae bacterium]|jgi:hypothetical protein
MSRFHITIASRSGQAMVDLVRVHKIEVLDHGARRTQEGFVVHAIVEEADIERLRDAGYAVERHEDVDETGRARQREVGVGDRYKKDRPADPKDRPD